LSALLLTQSVALAASPQSSGFQDIHPCLSVVGWHCSCVPSWQYNVRWIAPLSAILCGLLTIERAWSRDHATSSVTAVLPPPGQHCGTALDNSNDHWKHLCLVSWVSCAAAPCVWAL